MTTIRRLVWDARNVAHIARRQVTPEEVKQVCHGSPVVWDTYAGRIMVVGPTKTARMLAVVLAPKGGDSFYPVTARPADARERRRFRDRSTGGGD